MKEITFEGFITKLRKQVRDSYQNIGEAMIAGGIDSMDKYKYLLGQAHAYQYIDQEISNLLNPKEQKNEQDRDDTNIIKFDGHLKD
jgi:ribonucleotide reductase alpha subunit